MPAIFARAPEKRLVALVPWEIMNVALEMPFKAKNLISLSSGCGAPIRTNGSSGLSHNRARA
jgi:hypothetical protein